MQNSNTQLKNEWEVPEIDLNLRHYSGSVCDVFKKIKQDIVNYLSTPNVPEKTRKIYSAIYNALNYYETLSPEFKENNEFIDASINTFNEDFEYLSGKYTSNSFIDAPIISVSARIKSPLSFVEKVKDKINVYLDEDRDLKYFNESLRDIIGVRVVVNPPNSVKKLGLQAESDYLYNVFYDLMTHRGIKNGFAYPAMNKFKFLDVNTRYDKNKLQKIKANKYSGKLVLSDCIPTPKEQEAINNCTCIVKPKTRPFFMETIDSKVKDYHFYPKKSGYQSIHICVVPPFYGMVKTPELPACIIPAANSDYTIEYQFRDFREDEFSNRGPASHKTLKPFEKIYHRLAIPSFIDLDGYRTRLEYSSYKKALRAKNFGENYQKFYGPTFEDRFNIDYQLFNSIFDEETRNDILAEKKVVVFNKETNTYIAADNSLPVFVERKDRDALSGSSSITEFLEKSHFNDSSLGPSTGIGTSTENKKTKYHIKLYKVIPGSKKRLKHMQKKSTKPITSNKNKIISRRRFSDRGRDD